MTNPQVTSSKEEVFRLCGLALSELGSDVAAGARYADSAYRMAREIKDRHAVAEALRMKAHADYRSARYRRACRTYERAIRILDSLGEPVLAARTRSSALHSLIYAGRNDEALAWAESARTTFEAQNDLLRLARLDANVGNVLYRQERHGEAIEAYTRALIVLRSLGDDESAAINLKNMAVAFIGTMQFDRALACFEEARQTFVRLKLTVLENEVDINVAYLNFLEGNYTRALDLYRVSRSRDGQNRHTAAIALLDQSDLYLELNLFQEAAHLAAEAMDEFGKLRMHAEKARSLQNLGMAHLHLGNLQLSLGAFGRVRSLFLREKNPVWAAVADLSRALALEAAGNTLGALALAEGARTQLRSSTFVGKAILAAIVAARLHLRGGNPAAAHSLAIEALTELGLTNAPHLQLGAQMILAESAAMAGNQDAALGSYLAAHTLAEGLRQRLIRDELQLSFLQDKRSIYEGLVGILIKREDLEGAFRFVEYAKSRSLADSLSRQNGPFQSELGQTQEIRVKLRRLYRRLDTLEARPDPIAPPSLNNVRQQTLACEQALSLAVAGAAGAAGDVRDVAPATLAQVQAALEEDAAFLQYFIVRESLILLVVTRTKVRSFDLGPVSEVQETYRLLRFQLGRGALPLSNALKDPSWLPATQRHLERLHSLLIAPARDWLPPGHWTVAPHADLHRVPFHALFSDGRYIMEERTMTYVPSASVWLACLTREYQWRQAGATVLGVPDPLCPSIQMEAEAVAALLPGSGLFLGPQASLDRLKRSRGSRYIHIASHGVFRADNPAFSSLRLGDTRLCLFDLRELVLNAELVTLSGCATGIHESAGADEILGLTRGVLLAGARAAQVTLWSVNDASTAEYMKLFYSAVRSGTRLSEAHRSAMIGLKARYPHPYFWAPFMLTGAVEKKIREGVYQPGHGLPLTY